MVEAEQTLIRRGDFNAAMSLGDIQDKGRKACPGETSRQAMPQRAQSRIGRLTVLAVTPEMLLSTTRRGGGREP